jgi:two-component system chemotaxis sensor kinase CheA
MPKDPYKYFRVEARELVEGLARGVLDLEKGVAVDEVRPRLLRFAHTLKGAARVVRQPEIAELAHEIEDLLTAPAGGSPAPRASWEACFARLDAITARLGSLGAAPSPEPAPANGAPSPTKQTEKAQLETLRVDVAELDGLQEAAAETAAHLIAIREGARAAQDVRRAATSLAQLADGLRSDSGAQATALVRELDLALDRMQGGLARGIERAENEIASIRDAVLRLRLVPARSIFGVLERVVRDAALATGRAVTFAAHGGDTRIDAELLGALQRALAHVVRNAVVHGGQTEFERRAAGKPPALAVEVRVEPQGDRIVFACNDDGRGVDLDAVRAAAVHRGMGADEAAALDDGAALRLIFEGGLTTTGVVTEVSGRGVGLDVVRETAAAAKGDVDIRSERGRGTTIELRVPVSIWSLPALLVAAGSATAWIPLEAVRRALRVHPEDVVRAPQGDTIVHDGQQVRLASLERALGDPGARRERGLTASAIVIESGGATLALGVERLLGSANILLRPLPPMVQAEPIVLGAALDARGDPQLVLDPAALVRSTSSASGATGGAAEGAARRRRPVLVVDDSLTTRKLEQSILESAGYEVELATSGEEGLAVASARPGFFGLFVCDVEMPGMDGFEFITRTRADPALRDTPAILVTSRGSAEDRRRGERAGARGYIVKGEFDQARLLELVQELAG